MVNEDCIPKEVPKEVVHDLLYVLNRDRMDVRNYILASDQFGLIVTSKPFYYQEPKLSKFKWFDPITPEERLTYETHTLTCQFVITYSEVLKDIVLLATQVFHTDSRGRTVRRLKP